MAVPKDKFSKEKKQIEEKKPINLLSIPIVKKFIQSKWYPGIFQWIVLAVFSVIVYELVVGTVDPTRNVGTSLTWVLWWPLIPVFFLVIGRFWCAICPFGKLATLSGKR